VATSAPIRVDFDRGVDQESVAQRLSIDPPAPGRVTWPSDRELLYTPTTPLRTDTTYRVLLRSGYRSKGGGAADLDHTWYFRTEAALQVTDSNPAKAQRGVDPAAYLEVTFNHRMSPTALAGGFQLTPAVAVQATLAPADPFRVVIAPSGLLTPQTDYTLTITGAIKDADGNPLPKPVGVQFRTGAVRPLHGWLTCLAAPPGPPAGGDLWMVDQNRLPRELRPGPILDYAWAPSADELTVEIAPRSWADVRLDGSSTAIAMAVDRLLPLGGSRGFVYLDQGTLGLLSATGDATPLAGGVSEIAASPDGEQVAYAVPDATGNELWVLNVELRARSQLSAEAGAVSDITWAPDSARLAYQLVTSAGTSVRVRALANAAATTVAQGDVSSPAWDADAGHLYLLASRGDPSVTRLYRVPVASGLQSLTVTGSLPAPGLVVGAPVPSPDGHQVAFVGRDQGGEEVWLMNSDGTGLVRLTGGPAYAYSCRAPRWTPPA